MKEHRRSIIALTTGLYTGYSPIAPGTAGTALCALFLLAVGALPLWLHISFITILLIVGAAACSQAEVIFGKKDSGKIVIDEIVGMLITMIGIPFTGYWTLVGFLVFRFFDISKPPPARLFDTKVKNGWGVMLDDVVAGIYGNIILQLMLRASF